MKKPIFSVIVSNVGTVYEGEDEAEARQEFSNAVEASESGRGRWADEDVTLTQDGEPLEEHQAPRFVAGWNMPGYMPDSEPAFFETFNDAKAYILEELRHAQDAAESEEEAEDLAAFAEDVNLESGEFSAKCGAFVYWVRER